MEFNPNFTYILNETILITIKCLTYNTGYGSIDLYQPKLFWGY
jgi:hypothetical protein